LRIIFIGTPDFAVASLKAILESGFQVVAVVTAPDKPAGRGLKLQHSAVKTFALSKEIPILQPANLKNTDFLAELASYKSDIQVVIAFRMLPEAVWNMPPLGTFNLHASLLPAYRGAAPINWAIINGEKYTGVTTFFLKHEIDTGAIIFQEKVPIWEDETAGELHDKLMETGAKMVVKSLKAIAANNYPQQEQPYLANLPHAPKIFKPDCLIDWNKPANEVFNLIRGLSPYPAAYFVFKNQTIKVYRADIFEKESVNSGHYESDGRTYWHFHTATGIISIKDLQLEGRKRMDIETFLRGFNPNE